LSKTKFCICFENARDIPGYLTEKIFDCLFAGCIPIYWGEANVAHAIPSDCFIDFRKFADYSELNQFISTMTAQTFASYQEAAIQFLKGSGFTSYTSESFANCIVAGLKR
jgi:hypothetical protein